MARGDRERWNRKFREGHENQGPSARLVKLTDRLAGPRALELAAGWGANAAHLRGAGFRVITVDVADRVRPDVLADLDHFGLKPASVDTIVVTLFLERRLIPDWIAALRPGGTLFVETFLRGINPDWCLKPEELRALGRPLHYEECGDLATMLLARR
jgi:hypothetical protein